MKYRCVLFDLDGTLIDTNKLIVDSFKYTYKKHLALEVEEKEILSYFGEPLIASLRRYSIEEADLMYETFIKYNETWHDSVVKLFSGIDICLDKLVKAGHKIAVVTSKRRIAAERGLKLFDIHKYFEHIVAVEDTEKHKPEPEPILKVLELLKCKPEEAIMIGDSIFDIKCAKNAGVHSILVKWSAADGFQEENIEADYVVNNIEELLQILT